MTIFANPNVTHNLRNTGNAAGLSINIFNFDLADSAYKPAAIGVGDKIQIGTIPAGDALVPHLCRIDVPIIDSNGTPTGSASIGTTGFPSALNATGAVAAAQLLSGEDFALATAGNIGDANVDTPIYLTFTAAVATLAATGKITFVQITRALRQDEPAVG